MDNGKKIYEYGYDDNTPITIDGTDYYIKNYEFFRGLEKVQSEG